MSIYTQPTKPIWVTSREARKLLGVSVSTLYLKRKRGELTAKPINPNAKSPTWLYLYTDLEKQS